MHKSEDRSLGALTGQYLLQIVVGLVLLVWYRPSAATAYASTETIPLLLRAVHYWGSAVLILHGIVHTIVCVVRRTYVEDAKGYVAALLITLSSLLLQITGNVLPMDRHGVQTASIEAGIARYVPLVGNPTASLILGGDQYNVGTNVRWFGAHLAVGLLALAALAFAGRIRPNPKWAATAALAVVAIAAVVPAPLGSPATQADYNAFSAEPGWYVWPLHGMLVATTGFGAPWLGVAVLPALLVVALFALAFVSKSVERVARGTAALIGALFLAATAGYGGHFAPLVGKRDPVVANTQTTGFVAAKGQDAKLAQAGRKLFDAQGCANCHGKDGNQAKFGPSLKDVYKEHSDQQWYIRYIRNPQSVDKKSSMPAFPNLKPDELRALAEFLRFARN